MLYSAGEYGRARTAYYLICKALEGDLAWAFDALVRRPVDSNDPRVDNRKPSPDTGEALKAVESYAYAACQLSRIDYQFVDERPGPHRREGYAHEMITLAEKLEGLAHNHGLACFDGPMNVYVRRSLATHAFIARAFAGRHLVGAFTDVIPTHAERQSPALWTRLGRAIEQLEHPVVQTKRQCDADTNFDDALRPPVSWRWWALRCRYLARAYALRWLMGRCGPHDTGSRHPNEDLATAYRLIDEAFEGLIDPVAARDIVVTHLEMARLAIITIYGRLLCCNPPPQPDDLVWTVSIASHHLSQAVTPRGRRKGRGKIHDKDGRFLRALAMRLGSYVMLACDKFGLSGEQIAKAFSSESQQPSRDDVPDLMATFRVFLQRSGHDNVNFAKDKVRTMYQEFDAYRGTQRIEDFVTGFGQLVEEVEARMR